MRTILASLALLAAATAMADPAVIEDVEARATGNTWSFSVTLSHPDTGWDDYADGWRVTLDDGTIIATRTLFHPHVNEQPFTRSLGDVKIPEGVSKVYIEASTNVTGWDAERVAFELE